MSGGAGGKFSRGGPGAKDGRPDLIGGDFTYLRGLRSGRVNVWGRSFPSSNTEQSGVLLSTAGTGPDMLRAIPHFFPRAGLLGNTGWFNTLAYAGGGGALHFGIYADNGVGFPAELLWASAEFTSWADPVLDTSWRKGNPNLTIEAMTLYWIAWEYNDALRLAGQRVSCWNATESDHILGYFDPDTLETGDNPGAVPDGRPPGNASQHIGWRVPHTYGALPSSFPTTNARAVAVNNGTLEPTTLSNNVASFAYVFTPE